MLCSKCNAPADTLNDGGLCEGCRAQAEHRRSDIVDLARAQREQEGLVEIDANATLSEGNQNGCYLAAWVWVDFAGTRFDKQTEEHDA